MVTDEPLDVDVPQFSKDEVQKLADLVEKNLLAQRKGDDIDLLVNETHVPLNIFIKSFMARTILGMVSSLRGVEEPHEVIIKLRYK